MKLLRHVPNFLTCCNLLCGCVGILWVTAGKGVEFAAYFVWAACVFDFLDGFAARAFKFSSPIGKQLDSLADMVSFGVLPGLVFYLFINKSLSEWVVYDPAVLNLEYLGFLIPVFSALRLAKFNIDDRQKDSFIGLPVPANALFLTGLVFLPDSVNSIVFQPLALIAIVLLFSFLLVSPFELFALKFKNFSWTDNKIRFTFLLLAVLLLAGLQAGAISLIILLYVLISLLSRIPAFSK